MYQKYRVVLRPILRQVIREAFKLQRLSESILGSLTIFIPNGDSSLLTSVMYTDPLLSVTLTIELLLRFFQRVFKLSLNNLLVSTKLVGFEEDQFQQTYVVGTLLR